MDVAAAGFHRNWPRKSSVDPLLRAVGAFKEYPMRTHIRHAAVALALAAGAGAANAQTVITREITNEPVETIVERGPNGTVITRRPLDATVPRAAVTLPAGAATTETVETIATVRQPRETVGSATTARASTAVAPRRTAQPARPVAQKQRSTRNAAPLRN